MFCSKFRSKIKQLVRQIGEVVLENAALALSVTNAIKKFLSSPLGDILTAIIPGNVDDLIKARLVEALNYAIPLLEGFDTCSHESTVEEKLACLKIYLQGKYPDVADALLIKLAALITKFLDGHQLAQNQYDTAVQVQYSLNKIS
ncbi:MAG: hypothetical protein V4722_04290 [Bacteroidota bacterium]